MAASKTYDHKDHNAGEAVEDFLTGQDRPMEDVHPTAPAALVFAFYPAVLALAIIGMIIAAWLMS